MQDPANDITFANVTVVDRALTEEAIDHAAAAFKTWSKLTPKVRGGLVAKWGDLMVKHRRVLTYCFLYFNLTKKNLFK